MVYIGISTNDQMSFECTTTMILILLCSHFIQTHKISWKHDVIYSCLFMF
jgi:hypothetical protein